jgi:hypothetical protein
MSEIISEELNYSPLVNNHSTIIYRRVSPQGANSVTLSTAASVGPTEIIIAPSVFNMAKSRLNFSLSITAGTANKYNWLNSNGLSVIGRLVVYDSATNALLCDISNFSQYVALTTPSGTSFDSFATKALPRYATANVLPAATAAGDLYEDIYKCNNLLNPTFGGTTLGTDLGPNSYLGRRYCIASAADAIGFANFSIPLDSIKHAVTSLNKNVYSPSNLVLQIYWNATDNFCWRSGSATNPSTATVESVVGATISNIGLQLANEGNLAIVSQVINKVMTSGVSVPIAYPTVTRQNFNTAAPSYQLQLTKGYGQRILALITAPFAVSSSATANVANEHVRGNITQYNTFLNNVALRYPNGYSTTLSEDFCYGNREFMDKSTIQTLGEYILAEWFHCDSFFGDKPLHQLDQTQVDGLDVGAQSSTWSFQGILSQQTNYNWITAIIGQKVATFTNSGVMVQ